MLYMSVTRDIIPLVLESTVSMAKTGTNSLRATLPQGIVSYLNVKPGDKLQWIMNDKNNDRIVFVLKKRGDLRKTLEDAFRFEHLSV